MSKRFTKVYGEALWGSKRFLALTDKGKLLYVYLLGNGHSNSIGAYRLPAGYALVDLRWTADQYEAALAELIGCSLIEFDDDTAEVYVANWFKHSPAQNDKHAIGCLNQIKELESERIKALVQTDFDGSEEARAAEKAKVPLAEQRGSNRWPVRVGGRQ